MKIASVIEALRSHNSRARKPIPFVLVHTGQHYDQRMSQAFFRDLGLPNPDIDLEVGSASHACQTAEIMKRFEGVCLSHRPTHVLVVGDVNSTIACALVAKKSGMQVVHVEAGLRSFDRSMPEEINRILTDAISDVLFVTEESGRRNLRREGVAEERVHLVGNVMVDTLLRHREKAAGSKILERLGLGTGGQRAYGLLTLHRPANVDDGGILASLLSAVREVAQRMPVFFPVHPRTLGKLRDFNLESCFARLDGEETELEAGASGLYGVPPLGYLDFLKLMEQARFVMTDSGGIQEETTILRVPCVTIRRNTERPVTISHGTNRLAGTGREEIVRETLEAMKANYDSLQPPPFWDGKAGERIIRILYERYDS